MKYIVPNCYLLDCILKILLFLNIIDFTYSGLFLSDNILLSVFQNCHNLQKIFIQKVTPRCIQEMVKNCPNIIHFVNDDCRLLKEEDILLIIRRYKNLALFGLLQSGITDNNMLELMDNCPKLELLFIVDCNNVTDISITQLPNRGKALRLLHIIGTSITENSIKEVVHKSTNIKMINFEDMEVEEQLIKDIETKKNAI